MKKLLILLPFITLVGCASSQPQSQVASANIPTVPDFEVKLTDVEKKLNEDKIPSGFINEVFILPENIELVQRKILRKMQG